MAKVSIVQRNLKRQNLFKKNEKKREELKSIRNDKTKTLEERFEAQISLSNLPRNSSKTRIRNRCLLSGRGRGVYNKFKLSRIWFRKLASECKLPGVTKSSWS
ncbi:30S ribosomal protein S14 [Rickettsiales endosymbiont of Trichoplax sp. H2]|jgi:small subunit ribosomal protein S14|uniref:30S ribosomal protein S14 n=1 Tax=Rickettsiales endosymbiont of Trichoplax sp. H2 TaxID=2021221 RepID=UPI0012B43618|nr:30S ribosomal protein S14 [Rickettsiales endosymbiont of Trichoplax sp. H2]MSO13364.1 30S ribosomal protein S14 [Rickettsiales endosymbiont of Trichoplax sp. H2]